MKAQQRLARDCAISKQQRVERKAQEKIEVARVKTLKRKRVRKFTNGLSIVYLNPVGGAHCCKVRRESNRIFIVFTDGEIRKHYLKGGFYHRSIKQ